VDIFSLTIGLSLAAGMLGIAASVLAVANHLMQGKLPVIDWFGLLVSALVIALYLLLPFVDSKSETYSEILVSLVLVIQFLWGLFRTYLAWPTNILVAIGLFGLVSLSSLFMAFTVGGWIGANWAT